MLDPQIVAVKSFPSDRQESFLNPRSSEALSSAILGAVQGAGLTGYSTWDPGLPVLKTMKAPGKHQASPTCLQSPSSALQVERKTLQPLTGLWVSHEH